MKKSPAVLTIILILAFLFSCIFLMRDQIANSTQLTPQQSSNSAKILNPININTATAQELTLLPGIGEATAQSIVSYRQEQGLFESINDLSDVPGIGPETIRNISNYITVGE